MFKKNHFSFLKLISRQELECSKMFYVYSLLFHVYYGVCSKGVGVNSILCQICNLWIYKRCPGVKGTLNKESMFRYRKCKGEKVPNGSLNFTHCIHVDEDTFKAVPTFQYIGEVIGESGGCVDTTSASITTAWKTYYHYQS